MDSGAKFRRAMLVWLLVVIAAFVLSWLTAHKHG
jgi:hypothetical protein